MKKFRLSTWLGSPSSTNGNSNGNGNDAAHANGDDSEKKKLNRRSLSGLSQLRSKRDIKQENGQNGNHESKPAVATAAAPSGLDSTAPSVADPAPASTASPSRMVALAKKLSADAQKLEDYMRANGLPDAGFEVDAPTDFPPLPDNLQTTRREIMAAARELDSLVTGPRETVRWGVWSHLDTLSLQLINSYGIAKLVPFGSPIPLTELQSKTSLDPVNLARALRHAMTNRIFCEPSPGLIAHTAASRVLAEDSAMQGWVGFNAEDIYPASAHALQALKAHPEGTSLTRAGFNFAFGTVDQEPMFATLGKDPFKAQRFGRAMVSLTGGEGYEVDYFVQNRDFSDLNASGGTFVDIGGSHGFVCVALAEKWDKMNFVVQELPKMVASAPNPICDNEQVAKRIQIQSHDFFTVQPQKDADVYYFRWIMHNYSTPYAVKILQSLVPALKSGARIIINDICLRDAVLETPWDEKLVRSMDMVMLSLLNAQERTEAEFRALFEAADKRFVFQGVLRVPGCRMSVVEAVWEPSLNAAEES